MAFPPPSERQARMLWFSLTALAIGVLVGLLGLLFWGVGWVLNLLSPVLMPLAAAGILAYLMDPVVDFFSRKMSRATAIILVFILALLVVGGVLATVVPRLVVETRELVAKVPAYSESIQKKVDRWMAKSPLVKNIEIPFFHRATTNAPSSTPTETTSSTPQTTEPAVDGQAPETQKLMGWVADMLPAAGVWILNQLKRVASWFGVLVGLALIPVYLFYFLREKSGIVGNWTDYLPMRESKVKEEAIFIINSINDSLIVFFRGQVLVGLCSGALLTVGFLAIGVNYAFLLGAIAGILGIIPYLGVMISLVPAVILAAVQYGDWLHPLLVVALFALVNILEGFVISPKIIGDRVGLHPLTIIIAVMAGTTLMGGILGGVLAIPLTAALRALMYRYVWKRAPEKKRRK